MNFYPRGLAAPVVFFVACKGPVAAQIFPSKPIRPVVPYGLGACTDTMGRVVVVKAGRKVREALPEDLKYNAALMELY